MSTQKQRCESHINEANRKKLGARLSTIEALISEDYVYIWDCCCDHGLLGINLLTCNAAPNIHFVDVSPELIEQLERKLESHFTGMLWMKRQWRTYCHDASDIKISKLTGKHLIVIAGVGGDLTRDIVSSLIEDFNGSAHDYELDFLLCPIRQHYMLREYLKELGCRSKKEVLVEENKRIYEVMLVTYLSNRTGDRDQSFPLVCETGNEIWHPFDAKQKTIAKRYLDLLVNHYSRATESGSLDAMKRLIAYQSIEID